MDNDSNGQALALGTKITEFRITKVLGIGGFGIVYEAQNTYFDETVAIKEFFPNSLAFRTNHKGVRPLSPKTEETFRWALDHFLKEAKILWDLALPKPHPNIVHVTRLHEENGTAYMYMEYERGVPLSDIFKQQHTLEERELKAILFPLLDGLEHVHDASILHRDIKPENILIRNDKSPVLIDFGSAKQDMGDTAQSVMAAFSVNYGAPEQLYNVGKQGPWTDIYCLGATLYRIVTGEMPTPVGCRLHKIPLVSALINAKGKYSQSLLYAIDVALELECHSRPQTITEWRELLSGEKTRIRKVKEYPSGQSASGVTVISQTAEADEEDLKTSVNKPQESQPLPQKPERRRLIWTLLSTLLSAIVLSGVIIVLWNEFSLDHNPPIILDPTPPIISDPDPPTADERAALQQRIKAFTKQLECARLISSVSTDLEVSLGGYVGNPKDLIWLRSQLDSLDQNLKISENVLVYPHPFCRLVGVIQDFGLGAEREQKPLITFDNQSRIYREGEFLIIYVTSNTVVDGYLYVDYVDSVGQVFHLYPSLSEKDQPTRAGTAIVLGDSDAEQQYEVAPPHGRNMIIALWSLHPLPSQLGSVEFVENYLSMLNLVLDSGKGGVQNQFASSFEFIQTQE